MTNNPPQDFQLQMHDNFLYIKCSGKWDKHFLLSTYKPRLNAVLDAHTSPYYIPICDVKNWELPGYQATVLLHKFNLEIAKRFSYTPVILITNPRFLSLHEDIVNEFKLQGTGAIAKTFENYADARSWLEKQEGIDQQPLPQFPFQRSRTA